MRRAGSLCSKGRNSPRTYRYSLVLRRKQTRSKVGPPMLKFSFQGTFDRSVMLKLGRSAGCDGSGAELRHLRFG